MKIILQVSPSLLSYSLQQFFNRIKVKTVWSDLLKQCEFQDCLLNLNLLHPSFDYIWLELLIGREGTPMCRGAQSGSCYHLWILDDVQLAFLCGTGCSLGTKDSWGEGAPYPHPHVHTQSCSSSMGLHSTSISNAGTSEFMAGSPRHSGSLQPSTS